jgi:LysM domain-containing protein
LYGILLSLCFLFELLHVFAILLNVFSYATPQSDSSKKKPAFKDTGKRKYAMGTYDAGNDSYTVAAGDTPYSIALRFNISLPTLMSTSGLDAKSVIQPGQKLNISKPKPGQETKKSDSFYESRMAENNEKFAASIHTQTNSPVLSLDTSSSQAFTGKLSPPQKKPQSQQAPSGEVAKKASQSGGIILQKGLTGDTISYTLKYNTAEKDHIMEGIRSNPNSPNGGGGIFSSISDAWEYIWERMPNIVGYHPEKSKGTGSDDRGAEGHLSKHPIFTLYVDLDMLNELLELIKPVFEGPKREETFERESGNNQRQPAQQSLNNVKGTFPEAEDKKSEKNNDSIPVVKQKSDTPFTPKPTGQVSKFFETRPHVISKIDTTYTTFPSGYIMGSVIFHFADDIDSVDPIGFNGNVRK